MNRFATAALLLAVLSRPLYAQTSLSDLAGFDVPGLENLDVSNPVVGDDYFHGQVPDLLPEGSTLEAPTLVGFKAPGQTTPNVVVLLPNFNLSDYVPALTGTAAANVDFSSAQLAIVPAGNEGSGAAIPGDVSDLLGTSAMDLLPGTQIDAKGALQGELNEWMSDLGLPLTNLPLAGPLPAGAFTGQVDADSLKQQVDLRVTFDAPASWLAAARFDEIQIRINGQGDGWAASVAGSGISFQAGSDSVTFDSVTIARQDTVTTVTVVDSVSAGKLAGFDLPGLSATTLTRVTLAGSYIEAHIESFLGKAWDIVVARPDGLESSLFALKADSTLSFADLVGPASDSTLDQFLLEQSTLVYASVTAPTTISTPAPLVDRLGTTVTLRDGITMGMTAALNAGGSVQELLTAIGAGSSTGLPLSGTLPSSALNGTIVADALRPHVDLQFEEPAPATSFLEGARFTRPFEIRVKGETEGWDLAARTGTVFHIGADSVAFDTVRVEHEGSSTTVTAIGAFTADQLGPSVPGLSSLAVDQIVLGRSVAGTYLDGSLQFAGHGWDIVIAQPTGMSDPLFALVLRDTLSMSSFIDVAANTPLDDFQLEQPSLIYAADPPLTAVDLPPALVDAVGATATLADGFRIDAVAGVDTSAGSHVGDLLKAVGAAGAGLPLSGTLPAAVLDGISLADLRSQVDILVPIPIPDSSVEAFDFRKELNLHVKGDDTGEGWDVEVSTGIDFTLGTGVQATSIAFDSVSVRRANGETTISAFFPPDSALTIDELLSASIPGLGDVGIEGMTIGSHYLQGLLRFQEIDWDVLIAHPPELDGSMFALWPEQSLKLSDFIDATAGTALDEFSMTAPTLAYSAAAAPSVTMPPPIAARVGDVLTLGAGLTLDSNVLLQAGAIKDLLSAVNLTPTTLPVGGTLDLSVLSNPATLPDIDLAFPLPSVSLGSSSDFSTSDDSLEIAVRQGDPSLSIHTTVQVTVPEGASPPQIRAEITTGQDKGESFTELKGTMPADTTWSNAFGISWLDLTGPGIDARFGAGPFFKLTALTTIGSGASQVRNLDVEMTLATDWSIALLDADIPVSALVPGVDLTFAGDSVTLRDLTVSSNAFAGKGWTDPTDTLSVVLFELDDSWNLVVKEDRVGLADLVAPFVDGLPTPDPIDRIALEPAGTVISPGGLTGSIAALPPVAQVALTDVFGTAPLEIPQGSVGIVGSFVPNSLGSPYAETLSGTMGMNTSSALTLTGAIGETGVALAAGIPSMTLPPALDSLGIQDRPKSALFIDFGTEGLAFGVELDSLGLELRTRDHNGKETPGPVIETLSLGLTTLGFDIKTVADIERPWQDAMGIGGLKLDSGKLTLDLQSSGSGSIQLDSATTAVGNDTLRLDGDIGVTLGVLSNMGLGTEFTELTLADVVSLSGHDSLARSLPAARIQAGKLAFATPFVPDKAFLDSYGLDATGGIRAAGTLYLFGDDQPWGSIDATVAPDGITAKGFVESLQIGTVSLKACSLDVDARVRIPPTPPHFNFAGEIDTPNGAFAKGTRLIVGISPAELSLSVEENATLGPGADFNYEFGAFVDLPNPLEVNQKAMAGFDMGVDASIDLDGLSTWLDSAGPAQFQQTLDGIEKAVASFDTALAIAGRAEAVLADSVAAAVERVDERRAEAQAQVEQLQGRIRTDSTNVASLQGTLGSFHTSSCHETRRICSSYRFSFSRGVYCHHHKYVADVLARARCAAGNVTVLAEKAAREVEVDAAEATLEAARDALSAYQTAQDAVISTVPDSLDPTVTPLLLEKHAALLVLDAAQHASDDAHAAISFVDNLLAIYREIATSIVIHSAAVSGSLQHITQDGEAALATLDYDIVYGGATYPFSTPIPVKLTNPAYTAEQMALVGLNLGAQAVQLARSSGQDIPSVIDSLIQPTLRSKRAANDSAVARIHQAVGITPDSIAATGGDSVLGDHNGLSDAQDTLAAANQDTSNVQLSLRRQDFRSGKDSLRSQIAGVLLTEVLVDGSSQSWRVADTMGTSTTGDLSYLGLVSLRHTSDGPWSMTIATQTPPTVRGGGKLTFGFHPGSVTPSSSPRLTVQINGRSSTDVTNQIDMSAASWQSVEVPIAGGVRLLDQIRLDGSFGGSFYVDGFVFDVSRSVPGNTNTDISSSVFVDQRACVGTAVYSDCYSGQPPAGSGGVTINTSHNGPSKGGGSSIGAGGTGGLHLPVDHQTFRPPAGQKQRKCGQRGQPRCRRNVAFSVHPGNARARNNKALAVSVSSRGSGRIAEHQRIDLIAEGHVNLSQQRWQEVSIPLASFGHGDEDVEGTTAINFHLDVDGGLYIDDVSLTPPVPAVTAIEDEQPLPTTFQLAQSYPNPFNHQVSIPFELVEASLVNLSIYNSLGQRVRQLVQGERAPGRYMVGWDGRDATGLGVASGVYFYRLVTQSQMATRRMLLLK
ncbi:MAG: T9SS type A sorting domain-containing protein [Gemmatimonadetes bacterium]|nr:T9SS type A sorting domain-containing protein [Gemmatimonadota bacterium]